LLENQQTKSKNNNNNKNSNLPEFGLNRHNNNNSNTSKSNKTRDKHKPTNFILFSKTRKIFKSNNNNNNNNSLSLTSHLVSNINNMQDNTYLSNTNSALDLEFLNIESTPKIGTKPTFIPNHSNSNNNSNIRIDITLNDSDSDLNNNSSNLDVLSSSHPIKSNSNNTRYTSGILSSNKSKNNENSASNSTRKSASGTNLLLTPGLLGGVSSVSDGSGGSGVGGRYHSGRRESFLYRAESESENIKLPMRSSSIVSEQ
jgi:hypothetical protein